MTIYQALLSKGYFPKELPPAFFSEQFARYATTKQGRSTILRYKPTDNFTECTKYRLALPGLERRELKIPHPFSFASLASVTARHLSRLLQKASKGGISRSRPVYSTIRHRAIQPMVKPSNLSRERMLIRANGSFLLKADVSQFYPSLYTHAVGWAVDPKLRKRAHWQNNSLLGKQLDQLLMNVDGRVSQGVPIGNDISFLLCEIVLSSIDASLGLSAERAYRWFDDYEIISGTQDEAEATLKKLSQELGRFRLRLNPRKTHVMRLPQPAEEQWQSALKDQSRSSLSTAGQIVSYFDTAFRLRDQFPDSAVLSFALGILFRLRRPSAEIGEVIQSGISQTLLCEPGAAQKAFSLLSFWQLNHFPIDRQLATRTIDRMLSAHQASGLTSDIAWALAFCLQHDLPLSSSSAEVLSQFDDDRIAVQALHMRSKGLLKKGFTIRNITAALRNADLDREHWLLAYESVRHGFLKTCEAMVKANLLFRQLLARKVTFYRPTLPAYALVIHQGGAPEWVLKEWLKVLRHPELEISADRKKVEDTPVFELFKADLAKIGRASASDADAVADLLDIHEPEAFAAELGDTTYFR
jgi:hypothetical protein